MTLCPPRPERDYAPAKAQSGHAGLEWLNRSDNSTTTPEARLAQAKMRLMLELLGGRVYETPTPSAKAIFRDEAHRWFFGRSDFDWWCDAAGFDPIHVRQKAMKIYEHGFPERVTQQGKKLNLTPEARRLRRTIYHREYNRRRNRARC